MQIQTPDWVKQAVFYQIFPDRFARTQGQSLPPAMQVPLEASSEGLWPVDVLKVGGNAWEPAALSMPYHGIVVSA